MMESEEQNYTTEMKNRDSKKYENLHSDSGGQKSHPVFNLFEIRKAYETSF